MKIRALIILFALQAAVLTAHAAFQQVFMIGTDNATQSEFEQESANLVDYYWESDNYTPLGGVNWTSGQETWNSGSNTDTLGFPRALLHPGTSNTQTNIYFHLDANEAGPNQPIRLTLDLIGLKANTTHDLDVRVNGSAPFASRAGIATEQIWTIDTTAGAMGAVAGPNVLRVRRTGGTIDAGSAWIQFDYLRLEADTAPQHINTFTATPPGTQPGQPVTLGWSLFEPAATVSINQGVGDVTANTSGGTGSIVVNPLATTTYTLTATYSAVSQTRNVTATVAPFITSFTRSDPVVRPGESSTLSWTIASSIAGSATLSINQGIGPVTAPGGSGSIAVSPTVNTTYTLSVTYSGVTQTANVTLNASPWFAFFEAGLDNSSNAEFSHEVAADDNYYFAGDYTSVGGPNQVADEVLNDDADTNTAAGRTGNPAVGLERAVTEFDPLTNIWFVPPPAWVAPTARIRVTADVLSVGALGTPNLHDIELSINGIVLRSELNIAGARLVQFETTGLTAGLVTGPNKLTVRRTGGSLNGVQTLGGFVVFDYFWLEYLPATAPAITSVTDDPVLGTHTIAWTADVAKTYRVQKSTDAGATWLNMAFGFPTGGATSTSLFFEDRVTPFTDPRPDYRVLVE